MAEDPGLGYRVVATIIGVKGECGAGHKEGETFEISCQMRYWGRILIINYSQHPFPQN